MKIIVEKNMAGEPILTVIPETTEEKIQLDKVKTELKDYRLYGSVNELVLADQQAIRDIIVELRIKLGQGSSLSDFYTEFPFLPISNDI